MTCGCLEGVWRYLKGVWKVSGRIKRVAWSVSGECLVGVWKVYQIRTDQVRSSQNMDRVPRYQPYSVQIQVGKPNLHIFEHFGLFLTPSAYFSISFKADFLVGASFT